MGTHLRVLSRELPLSSHFRRTPLAVVGGKTGGRDTSEWAIVVT